MRKGKGKGQTEAHKIVHCINVCHHPAPQDEGKLNVKEKAGYCNSQFRLAQDQSRNITIKNPHNYTKNK